MDNEEAKRRRLASALDYRAKGAIMAPMNEVIDGVCQGRHEVAPGVWVKGGVCTCKPGKHPAGKWTKYRNAGTPNHLIDIHKWVERDQNLGVLMDCGALRIWVADCDTPEARDYVESILGKTPCVVETGRNGGGWHLYYLLPNGVSMKADNGDSFPGLDIKTSGYVIAPWGRHHSGRYYTPQDGFDLTLAPIADPHLLKPVMAPSASTRAASGSSASKQGMPPKNVQPRTPRDPGHWYFYGQRNNRMYDAAYRFKMARHWLLDQGACIQGKRGRRRLFRYTCELVRWYLLDADQTFQLLMEFNRFNVPPFSSQELVDVVDKAFVLGTWSERGRLSYARAHAREKAKSMKSSERRAEMRAAIRNEMWEDLMDFVRTCCDRDDGCKATTTELWAGFCNFAPWAGSYRGVFGAIIQDVMAAAFPSGVKRKKDRNGNTFTGVLLRHDYLEYCANAA